MDGYGTLTFKNGTKFVGMFKDGLRHGDGSIYYKGSVEMGKWVNGKLSSKIWLLYEYNIIFWIKQLKVILIREFQKGQHSF